VDAALGRQVGVVIIGGAAAAVHYGIDLGTHDIDTWTSIQEELARAVEQARTGTGLPLPFAKSGVADGPYDFESRLERALPHLQRLVVQVPEKHDQALMKVIRGYEHDLDGIEAIHRRSPLELETLLKRYRDEMGAVVGAPRRLRGQLLALVDRLFPERVEAVARQL